MRPNLPKNFIQKIFSFVFCLTALHGAIFHTAAQTRRPTVKKQAPAGSPEKVKKAITTPAPDEKIDLSQLVPPDRSKFFGEAFRTGRLPSATVPMPEGNASEQARALADMIKAGDANSIPALITALKAAGYGIRSETTGDVAYNQGGWQGIAFDEWQVAAMAKLYGDGFGVGLGKFGESLSLIAPEWKAETNAPVIAQAIRAASTSENPSLKFWANFIIELGNRADTPFDLRNDEDVKHARLDAIQISLILTRLGADLHSLAQKKQRRAGALESDNETNQPGAVRFLKASYNRRNATTANPVEEKPLPCSLSEKESVILDYNAVATTEAFGILLGHLEKKDKIGETPGALLGAVNAVLILVKLISTYAALGTEVTMEGEQLLTRTETTQEGERKALTAKVKIESGKWQMINCIRPALNLGGIDFSLPGTGAIANSRVDWKLMEGGITREHISKIKTGRATGTDALVYLDTQSEAKADDKGKYYNYTDSEGASKIYAVGMPQKRDLSREPVRAVMKQMAVSLDIQVKTMKLKDGVAAAGTAGDLADNVIAFLGGDLPGGIVGTVAETIYRSPVGMASKVFVFPVKDWIPCDGKWRGTVTYQRIFTDSATGGGKGIITDGGFSVARNFREYMAEINVEQVPGQNPYGDFKVTANISSVEEVFRFSRMFYRDSCGNKTGSMRDKITESFFINTVKGAGSADAESFSMSIYADKANIHFSLPEIPAKSITKEAIRTGGFCNENKPFSSNRESDSKVHGMRYGQQIPVDPKNPNMLRGTMTIPGSKGWKMVFSWNLSRCQ